MLVSENWTSSQLRLWYCIFFIRNYIKIRTFSYFKFTTKYFLNVKFYLLWHWVCSCALWGLQGPLVLIPFSCLPPHKILLGQVNNSQFHHVTKRIRIYPVQVDGFVGQWKLNTRSIWSVHLRGKHWHLWSSDRIYFVY